MYNQVTAVYLNRIYATHKKTTKYLHEGNKLDNIFKKMSNSSSLN